MAPHFIEEEEEEEGIAPEESSHLQEREEEEEEEEEEEMTFTIPFTSDGPIPLRPVLCLLLVTFIEGVNHLYYIPFLVFQVLWMGVSLKSAGIYVGLMAMGFYLAQFLNNAIVGKLSDYIGRKPIFLFGFGLSCLCSIAWGFSTTFPMVVAIRFLQGLLNGDLPMVKSYFRDCSTERNMARLYSFRSFGFLSGWVVGPLIGGYFSRPSNTWPNLFPPSSLFDTYPFLLPCLIVGFLNFVSLLLCLVFMKESLPNPLPLFVGLRQFLNSMSLRLFFCLVQEEQRDDIVLQELNREEMMVSSLDDKFSSSSEQEDEGSETKTKQCRTIRLLKEPFILLAILMYGFMACISIIFTEVFALWAVISVENHGLGFTERNIGLCMAVGALGSLFFSLFFFPPLNRKLGSLFLWKVGVGFGSFLYLFLPLLSWLIPFSQSFAIFLLYLAFVLQKIHVSCNFSTVDLMVTNLAPTDSIGSVIGLSTSCSAFFGILSPLLGGVFFARTSQSSLSWPFGVSTVFTALGFMCFCLLILSMIMKPDKVDKRRTTPLDHQE